MKWGLLTVVFIIVILVAAFHYLGEQKDTTVMVIQVAVKGNASNATIEEINAHLEQTTRIRKPKSNFLITPGITVLILQNKLIIGEWMSVPFNGTGIYKLVVGLSSYPKPGESISVVARILDGKSRNIAIVQKEITLT